MQFREKDYEFKLWKSNHFQLINFFPLTVFKQLTFLFTYVINIIINIQCFDIDTTSDELAKVSQIILLLL